MAEKLKINPKKFLVLGALLIIASIYLGLDYFFKFTPETEMKPGGKLIIAIIMLSLGFLQIMEFFNSKKDRKIYHIIGLIFLIPLIPLFIVGILSQTKLLASLTLPVMVLGIVAGISTLLYQQLELLHLGFDFNNNVIPYLNLTTITVIFIFLDKYLVKALAFIIPEHQMPKAVKDITFELLEKKYFVKIAYVALTCLLIISTVENLGKTDYIHFLGQYKNVALQSLVTFAAIDRLVSKWKTKKITNA